MDPGRLKDERELQEIMEKFPQAAGKSKCPDCLQPADPNDCDDPRDWADKPIGMFHCPGCGVMQIAGSEHVNCDFCGGTGWIPRDYLRPVDTETINPEFEVFEISLHCHDGSDEKVMITWDGGKTSA